MIKYNYALLAGLLLAALSCTNVKEEAAHHEAEPYCLPKEIKESLEIREVAAGPVTESIHLMGSVEADPDRVTDYVSLIKGVVSSVNFSLGDRVQKGQVLAELNSTELSALNAQAATLQAQLKVAGQKLKTVEALFNDGLAAQKDLAEARSELEVLQSESRRTNADLRFYGASSGGRSFQIKAPASGVIVAKNMVPGTQLSDEKGVLFTVASLENVWILANVYASNLQHIQPGMAVEATTPSYPGRSFRGSIAMLPQVMDNEEKVLKARVRIQNPDLALKPGMLVDVTALKQRTDSAVSVPADAVVFYENQNYVVVYKNNCAVELRPISLLAQNNRTYYIASGLQAGEKIITRNQLLVFEQLKNFDN